jgi:ADP-heptose:LPS heptosyltransferase
MVPHAWRTVKKILAVRLDNIGDVIMLGPALRTLRQALPRASLTLLATPAGGQVASLLPWIDDLLTFRPVWQDIFNSPDFDGEDDRRLIELLRGRRYDAAVIFSSFPQSPHCPAYLCYLAGIPRRLGQSKEFAGSVLTQAVKPLPDYVHQVDRNLFLLEQAGFRACGRHLELAVPVPAVERADALLREIGLAPGEPFILLAPGASCASRRYGAAQYAAMLPMLPRRTGMRVLVVGSEREQGLARALSAGAGPAVRLLFGRTTVPELAALIRRAAFVIANNSASLHIADAFRKPMVVLYSGTDILEQWRPRFAPARVLNVPVRCAPCYQFDCTGSMECLEIPPEEVVDHVVTMLGTPAPARHGTAGAALRCPAGEVQ